MSSETNSHTTNRSKMERSEFEKSDRSGGIVGVDAALKRRKFLLRSAAFLAAGSADSALAQGGKASRDRRFGKPRSQGRNRYANYPGSGGVPNVVQKVRNSDWLADECYYQRHDRAGAQPPRVSFPDEFLGTEPRTRSSPHSVFLPYHPGELVHGDHEPPLPTDVWSETDIAEVKKHYESLYDRWVATIGSPFSNSGDAFDEFIEGLMERISRLNASKYWLRLCHLKSKPTRDTDWMKLPPIPTRDARGAKIERRPYDDIFNLPNASWPGAVEQAESDLKSSADEVRAWIEAGTSNGMKALVDPVMCNDYVVGIRVVADSKLVYPFSMREALEPGGSSSSYVRVSSPFSSYTPPPPPVAGP